MRGLEVALAVFAPVAISIAITRLPRVEHSLRRAALVWFAPLVLVWYAPFWLTGTTIAPLDFLFFQIPPWKHLAPPGFISGNGLLSDSVLQFLPWRDLVVDAYRHGELPLLNRYAGSGSPLWANPQAQVLSPITLAGLPFSTFAWPVFASVCKTLIALWGMFLFLRKLALSDRAATLGAIGWAFCTFNFAFALFPHTEVTALLPWLMLAIHEASIAGSAIVAALMLLGGHPESVLHVAFLAVPYGLREAFVHRDRTMLLRLGGGALIAFLLAGPVVLPFLALLPHTERVAHYATRSAIDTAPAMTPLNMAAAIFPAGLWSTRSTAPSDNFNEVAGYYAGLAALALAICASLERFRENRFWIIAAVVFFLISFSSPLHELLLGKIPVIGVTAHGRARFLVAFIIAVLAARAVDAMPGKRTLLVVSGVLAGAVVVLAALAPPLDHQVVIASAAAGLLSLVVLARPGSWRLLPLFIYADLAILGIGYHAPAHREMFYPPTGAIEFLRHQPRPFRVIGLDRMLMPNTSAIVGIENIAVHDPMTYEPYERALAEAGYDRSGYFGVFAGPVRHDRLDEWNVRYVVGPPSRAVAGLPLVYRGADATVYENRTARPRYSVTPGEVRVVEYGRNGVILDITSPAGGEAVAREAAVPGWHLTRNGRDWPFTEGGAVALRWQVPRGSARYRLTYSPPGLAAGFGCGVAGLLALGYLLLVPRNSQRLARR